MPQSNPKVQEEFSLLLGDGRNVHLSDYRGRWLVLYFYPKDNTPGCTLEGIDFNALLPALRKAGAEVLGVSRDSVKSHAGFCAKHGFGFDLVSDPDDALGNAYGVIGEKSLYGRKFIGVVRSTFLIDPQGVTVAEWRKVKVAGHAEAVLAELLARTGQLPGTAKPAPGVAKKAAPAAKKSSPAAKKSSPAAKKAPSAAKEPASAARKAAPAKKAAKAAGKAGKSK